MKPMACVLIESSACIANFATKALHETANVEMMCVRKNE